MSKKFQRLYLLLALLLGSGLLVGLRLPPSVRAASLQQIPIYTPTPLPDGRIIYTIKENDTLLSISLLTGVSVDELRKLNNLRSDNIIAGQPLLLGLAGPVETTPTPGPSPTPTQPLPTATPKSGSGNLCVLLYEDANGDSIRQETEHSIPNGAISVSNRAGSVSYETKTASGMDPQCFEKLPEGDYSISVAAPSGFNSTTVMNYSLSLKSGDETYLGFGAQKNSEVLAQEPLPLSDNESRSPILGILGGLLLASGVGLALFAGRLLKGK